MATMGTVPTIAETVERVQSEILADMAAGLVRSGDRMVDHLRASHGDTYEEMREFLTPYLASHPQMAPLDHLAHAHDVWHETNDEDTTPCDWSAVNTDTLVPTRSVPTTVASFAELHDYVDANTYGGMCDEIYDALGDDDAAWATYCNAVTDAVDAWLRTRAAEMGL